MWRASVALGNDDVVFPRAGASPRGRDETEDLVALGERRNTGSLLRNDAGEVVAQDERLDPRSSLAPAARSDRPVDVVHG
jgi:hypothetical protein